MLYSLLKQKAPIVNGLTGLLLTLALSSCAGGSSDANSDNSPDTDFAPTGSVILSRAGEVYTDASSIYDLVVSPGGMHAYFRIRDHNSDIQSIGCLAWDSNELGYKPSSSCNLNLDASPRAIDSQGQTLYVTDNSSTVPRLRALSIDRLSGSLAQIQQVDLSFFPGKILVRPDDAFVYVTHSSSHEIAIYARSGDGTLTRIQSQYVQGIFSADIYFSPSGNLLLAGYNDRVTSITVDSVTGLLSGSDSFGQVGAHGWSDGLLDSFSSAAFNKDGTEVYVFGKFLIRTASGFFQSQTAIVNLGIDVDGTFTYKYHLALDNSDFASNVIGDIAVNHDDEKIYVMNKRLNHRKYASLDAYSLIKFADTDFQISQRVKVSTMQGNFTPIFRYVPDHRKMLVTAKFNGGAITAISIDDAGDIVEEKALSLSPQKIEGLNQIVNAAASGNNYVFSLSAYSGDSALNTYRYNNNAGEHSLQLTDSIRFSSIDYVIDVFYPQFFVIAPDDKYVYVLGRGPDTNNSNGEWRYGILRYSLNPDTGQLSKLPFASDEQYFISDSFGVYSAIASNDGLSLYIAYQNIAGNMAILVLQRDPRSGDLNRQYSYDLGVEAVSECRTKPFMQISNDDESLYFFYKGAALLAQFNRSTATGELELESTLQDSDLDIAGNRIDGLIEASGSAISGNDEYLYVASDEIHFTVSPFTGLPSNTVGLNVFKIDSEFGQLTSIQKIDRRQSPDILGGYKSILLSANGTYLFAIVGRKGSTCGPAHGIDVYEVDRLSGQLSFIQRMEDPILDRGTKSLFPVNPYINGLIMSNERNDSIEFLNY